ncbi:MAG: DUF6754 domain-containing protein [bacterium]
MKRKVFFLTIFSVFLFLSLKSYAQISVKPSIESTPETEAIEVEVFPKPPGSLSVSDNPNDDGSKLILTWKPSVDEKSAKAEQKVVKYAIKRSTAGGKFEDTGEVVVGTSIEKDNYVYVDKNLKYNENYSYRIYSVSEKNIVSREFVEISGVPKANLFNLARINVLLFIIAFACFIIYFVYHAKKGTELYVRPIAGLEAVDEAIGRATEMGKPILYISGLHPIEDISTIAAVTILGRVARKVAEYESRLIVPNYDPVVMLVEQEVVKQAYLEAGHPDAYSDDMVFYITTRQFSYVAAVDGIMIRERPAANFFMGYYYAESLILAETGAATGAIQIAGTDSVTQLPFFITACDYTLIGEELYAASAYLSKEPLLLGTLKAQDIAKLLIAVIIFIGIVTSAMGIGWFQKFFIAK